jgi:hypothetical protein
MVLWNIEFAEASMARDSCGSIERKTRWEMPVHPDNTTK